MSEWLGVGHFQRPSGNTLPFYKEKVPLPNKNAVSQADGEALTYDRVSGLFGHVWALGMANPGLPN